MNVKQAVVVRKDLNMIPGLLAAQVAHLSAMPLINRLTAICYKDPTTNVIVGGPITEAEKSWYLAQTLVVLSVNNNEELEVVYQRVKDKVLNNIWNDTIYSELFKTYLQCRVGIVIGPLDDEILKQYTGDLPLYK